MSVIASLHANLVFSRRIQRLASNLSSLLPQNARVLDVGAGDGSLDVLIMQHRPDVRITGLDVLVRPQTAIPVEQFDGVDIPFPDKAWDVAMFVDVLHHADHAAALLREAARVAPIVIIKDHLQEGILARPTLRLMDYVGNAHHGVALPYNYWPRSKWRSTFAELGLSPASWVEDLHLYPFPLALWFDRHLHFITKLEAVSVEA